MQSSLEYFLSEVPVGQAGAWVVEKVVVPPRQVETAADTRPEPFKFRPGAYTCLRRGSTQFMTDLYDEWWTQRAGIDEALNRGGNILITGLGLGLVAEAMLRPSDNKINRIVIVEQSADVIRLVAQYLQQRYPSKIDIVEADAFTWEPPQGMYFSVGWHDIWPDPSTASNDGEMAQLENRYQGWCDWQGFWPKEYARALAG